MFLLTAGHTADLTKSWPKILFPLASGGIGRADGARSTSSPTWNGGRLAKNARNNGIMGGGIGQQEGPNEVDEFALD